MVDRDRIRKEMNNKTNEQLLNIVNNEKDNYTQEALDIIYDILEKRNVQDSLRQEKIINSSNVEVEKRYGLLKTVSNSMTTIAYLALFLTLIVVIISAQNIYAVMLALFISIIVVAPYIAFSEIIDLFIDLEENSRETNKLLQKLIDKDI
ncbi:MAG: hypothetical protein ACOCRK_01505 [bacterium]